MKRLSSRLRADLLALSKSQASRTALSMRVGPRVDRERGD